MMQLFVVYVIFCMVLAIFISKINTGKRSILLYIRKDDHQWKLVLDKVKPKVPLFKNIF